MALDAERRVSLAGAKLQALVRGRFPDVTASAQAFTTGVGIIDGDRAFVYVVDTAPSPLAAVLAWGERAGAEQLHLIVDDADPVLATQARGLAPMPELWRVSGTTLEHVDPAPLLPAGLSSPAAADAAAAVLDAAGCEVIVEHGVVLGEVEGLEVARVVLDPDGTAVVRVGVGLFDQEAHAVIHAEAPVEERLAQVVTQVASQRRVGAGPHPLNLVARERWLRSELVRNPAAVGLDGLTPVAPLAPRGGVRQERPASALGSRGSESVLVVCAAGIDLDLVPEAAGQLVTTSAAEVVLVLPERDRHPILERMARWLAAPASVVALRPPWVSG